ncbi:MAG: sigma-70 family RNA polymerase sigma factor [Clostridia bacterium]|nr:sigma-70 family RNA polymerase sigma factor [Clostridia bacterium]
MTIGQKTLHTVSEWKTAVGKMLLRRFGEVYYINGSETLPPPLSPEEEAEVLARFDEDRGLSDILIRHNLRLVVFIARKFESCGTGIEDLISIGTIGLIKAVNTYKTDRGIKLATYASRCIENEILMHIRKNAPHRGDLSIDEPLSSDWDGGELLLSDVLESGDSPVGEALEKEEDERTVREAVASLDEREREIIELRYGLGGRREMTQKEVADRLGISQSYISRLEKRIIERLRRQIARKV